MPVPETSSRECGACTVCCYAPAIEPLNKPTGVRCQYLTIHGCGVYHERPNDPKFKDCITFRCLWLNGIGEASDRPDQIGAALMEMPDPDAPGTNRVHVLETVPGSAKHPRVRALIDRFLAAGQTVAIVNAETVVAIKPNGSAWRFKVDPKDPLRTHVDPKTVPVRIMVRGQPIAEM